MNYVYYFGSKSFCLDCLENYIAFHIVEKFIISPDDDNNYQIEIWYMDYK